MGGTTAQHINSMCHLFALHHFEIAIVATRRHPFAVTQLHRIGQFANGRGAILGRFIDPHSPAMAIGIYPLRHNLTTDLHQIVGHPISLQCCRHEIHHIPFGEGGGVERHPWIGLDEAIAL